MAVGASALTEVKGVNFVGMPYTRVAFSEYRAKLALEHLATTGANWISIPITFYQDFKNSSLSYIVVAPLMLDTGIHETPAEKDVLTIVQEAKKMGLKVMLQFQAMINMPYWPDSRDIGDYWVSHHAWKWFPRYTENIIQFLTALNGTEIDMISLGHNHYTLGLYEYHWRNLASSLRNVTTAKLTYSAAFGDEDRQTGFWDALDYIGVFPKLKSKNQDDLKKELKEFSRTLLYLNKLWKKPVIVTRTAACHGAEGLKQEELMREVFEAVKGVDFVQGIFFGDWAADRLYAHPQDYSYNIAGKPAESTVRELFEGQKREVEFPSGKVSYVFNCDCFKSVQVQGK